MLLLLLSIILLAAFFPFEKVWLLEERFVLVFGFLLDVKFILLEDALLLFTLVSFLFGFSFFWKLFLRFLLKSFLRLLLVLLKLVFSEKRLTEFNLGPSFSDVLSEFPSSSRK